MKLESTSPSKTIKKEEPVIDTNIVPVTHLPQDVVCNVEVPKLLSEKTMDWTFFKSNAFYAGIIGSAGIVLVDPNFATNKWYFNLGKFLGLVTAAFWSTRTIDRVTDKLTKK